MTGLHVAVIMDGNGRWARQRRKPRWRGHVAGVDSVRDAVRTSPDLGVTTLTLYAFSSDNWKRPAAEVGRLFWLLREYCAREEAELIESGVKVTAIGRRDRIPGSALAALQRLERRSAGGRRLHLRLAIDYSGQWAISDAARRIAAEHHEITPDALGRLLTAGAPPVDLLVRTGGEQRLSDFLLWESAYAELLFTDVLWPDFRRNDLVAALSDFRKRERRFGGLAPVVAAPDDELRRAAAG